MLYLPVPCFNRRREANPLATQIQPDRGLQRRLCFNRRREANPLATQAQEYIGVLNDGFQSQTRSQSPGDSTCRRRADWRIESFNRRREANPLATTYSTYMTGACFPCFNRRREANPLATQTKVAQC